MRTSDHDDGLRVEDAADLPSADAARILAFRRSGRASRTRRRAAAARRRRLLRGRGAALLAIGAIGALSAGAVAQQGDRGSSAQPAGSLITAAQKALGVSADGVVGPQTRRAVRRFQRERGLRVDGVIGPQTLRALGLIDDAAGAARTGSGAVASTLERIAACESGGDPTAVSADGRYRGKYQFSRDTWRQMGGRGDPARASEDRQDALAAKLLARAGTSPWPSCA